MKLPHAHVVNLEIFQEEYTCNIIPEAIGKNIELDRMTSWDVDWNIQFTYNADAGRIAEMLAQNEINFLYNADTIFLSHDSLISLLEEASELWL